MMATPDGGWVLGEAYVQLNHTMWYSPVENAGKVLAWSLYFHEENCQKKPRRTTKSSPIFLQRKNGHDDGDLRGLSFSWLT